jgi:hypothetical protein
VTDVRQEPVRRQDFEETAIARTRAAIEAGDQEAALAALDDVVAEAKPIHDLYGDMAASLLTFIGERLGEEGVHDATRHMAEDTWRPVVEMFAAQGDTAAFAAVMAGFLKSHGYEFSALEDDERWVFAIDKCTSGERMVREGKVEGLGSGGHGRFGTVPNTFDWAHDSVERIPHYDVHWIFMSELPEEYGWPVLDVNYGPREDGVPAVQEIIVLKEPRAAD